MIRQMFGNLCFRTFEGRNTVFVHGLVCGCSIFEFFLCCRIFWTTSCWWTLSQREVLCSTTRRHTTSDSGEVTAPAPTCSSTEHVEGGGGGGGGGVGEGAGKLGGEWGREQGRWGGNGGGGEWRRRGGSGGGEGGGGGREVGNGAGEVGREGRMWSGWEGSGKGSKGSGGGGGGDCIFEKSQVWGVTSAYLQLPMVTIEYNSPALFNRNFGHPELLVLV